MTTKQKPEHVLLAAISASYPGLSPEMQRGIVGLAVRAFVTPGDLSAANAPAPAPAAKGEAVAWCLHHPGRDKPSGSHTFATEAIAQGWATHCGAKVVALYAQPQPSQEPELRAALTEVLSALSPLSVMGKPIAALDTRLSRAINDAVMMLDRPAIRATLNTSEAKV